MYAKGKTTTVPSDAQAREKLALYVYEYLLHVGAQKAAQTFLSEIRWEKNITLGEPPGFLHSWWCVFWDLYCAAPERRDTCEHSSEAKAFYDHDYGFVNSGYGVNGMGHNAGPSPNPMGQMPPTDHMGPGFFPPFMGPRFPSGPRQGVRMPQLGNEFNGPPGQPMMPSGMDPTRAGGPGMNPRMNPPRGPGMVPGTYGPGQGMRGPPPNTGLGPGPGGPPMPMGPGGRPQWQPNSSTGMNYSSSSPGKYGGPPGGSAPPGPGTPILPSPQGSVGPYSPASHRMPTPSPVTRQDSSNPGGESMYTMMKSVPGGSMPGEFGMGGSGPGNEGPVGGGMGVVMNGDGNSPAGGPGPGTPREDSGGGMGDYNLAGFGPNDNVNMGVPASFFSDNKLGSKVPDEW